MNLHPLSNTMHLNYDLPVAGPCKHGPHHFHFILRFIPVGTDDQIQTSHHSNHVLLPPAVCSLSVP